MAPQIDEIVVEEFSTSGPGYTFIEYALSDTVMDALSTSISSTQVQTRTSTTTGRIYTDFTTYVTPTVTDRYSSITSYALQNSHSNDPIVSLSASVVMSSSGPLASGYTPYLYSSINLATASSSNTNASVNATQDNDNGSPQHSMPGFAKVIIGVVLAITALATIMTCVFCVKRRKARKAHRQWQLDNEKDAPRATTSDGSSRGFGSDLTRDELFEVVPLPPPVIASQPVSLPRIQTSFSGPTNHANRRISAIGSDSRWSDNSEMDAFATDGSSIARTLSTHSAATSRASSSTVTENPFDHPAYTLLSGRSRHGHGQSSAGNGTWQTGTGTYTPIATPTSTWNPDVKVNPFSDNSNSTSITSGTWVSSSAQADSRIVSPTTPTSATALIPSSRCPPPPSPTASQAPTERSWTTEDDVLLGTPRPDLSRGMTVIRHVDAGPGEIEMGEDGMRRERRRRGEVHLPPTYNELYPSPRR